MKINIDNNKIENFYDVVNSNSNFVYQKYENKGGKNQWNVICSCMNWISVAVRSLNNASDLNMQNIDIKVMQVYSLISAIDIISEAIAQLHRVFVNNKTQPFKNERTIFKDRAFNVDDNIYFKELRASFGAHPVNLNERDNSKWFASWPYESVCDKEGLNVSLYSNNRDYEDIILFLDYNELKEFVESRYNYLDVIIKAIEDEYNTFAEQMRKDTVHYSNLPIEQLYILKEESQKRLDNEHYNSIIEDLIRIYKTTLDKKYVVEEKQYKDSLLILIEEIKSNLQSMNVIDLVHSNLLRPRYRSKINEHFSYCLQKFYVWVSSEDHDYLLETYLKAFNEESDGYYNFSLDDDPDTSFLKLNLMLMSKLK